MPSKSEMLLNKVTQILRMIVLNVEKRSSSHGKLWATSMKLIELLVLSSRHMQLLALRLQKMDTKKLNIWISGILMRILCSENSKKKTVFFMDFT